MTRQCLFCSLVQVAVHAQEKKDTRQRRASESDSMEERMPAIGKAKNVDIMQMLSQAQHEYDKVRQDVDIMQMLSQAQHEYDKVRQDVDIMQMLSQAQNEYDKVRQGCGHHVDVVAGPAWVW